MKPLNRYQLNTRIRENYHPSFWNQMTDEEKQWVKDFENMEHQIERGKAKDATQWAHKLSSRVSDQLVEAINSLAMDEERGDVNAYAKQLQKDQRRGKSKGIRKPKSNMYVPEDHKKHNGTTLDDDGVETERGIATNPEENLAEAIHESQEKKCSLEKLVQDYKLSKVAKADILARTQTMTYRAMTYTFHGTEFMNLNYVLKGVNGQMYVQDQHDRIQSLELYLTRHTNDSYATHAEVWYPGQAGQTWVFKAGAKSNIEGKAVRYEVQQKSV